MRNRNAQAHAGASQALTLKQGIKDAALVDAGNRTCMPRQILQRLLLAGGLQVRNDAVWCHKIGNFHIQIPFRPRQGGRIVPSVVIAKLAFVAAYLFLSVLCSLVEACIGIRIGPTTLGMDVMPDMHRDMREKVPAFARKRHMRLNRVSKVFADACFEVLCGVGLEGLAHVNLMPGNGNLHWNLCVVARLEALEALWPDHRGA